MSKIIKKVENRDLAHIVKVGEKYYYVDSTFFYSYYETMAFEYDIEEDEVSDWNDEYCERYFSEKEMKKRHNEIINHLEDYLDKQEVEENESIEIEDKSE